MQQAPQRIRHLRRAHARDFEEHRVRPLAMPVCPVRHVVLERTRGLREGVLQRVVKVKSGPAAGYASTGAPRMAAGARAGVGTSICS